MIALLLLLNLKETIVGSFNVIWCNFPRRTDEIHQERQSTQLVYGTDAAPITRARISKLSVYWTVMNNGLHNHAPFQKLLFYTGFRNSIRHEK
jgi:hypothetical protein